MSYIKYCVQKILNFEKPSYVDYRKPGYLLETFYEFRKGYQYKQPVERIKGKSFYEYNKKSHERINWGDLYWKSKKYNDAIIFSRYHSNLWKSGKAKKHAFNMIYNFIIKGKSGTGSSITKLFPFELFLLNDGFKMVGFCELNAINPGRQLICDAVKGDVVTNPIGFYYPRTYVKKDVSINIVFGFGDFNFCFKTSNNPNNHFQIDNNIHNYKSAINGKLKPLNTGK